MASYKRFLSYLFAYEKDQKKENCGFARVEIRGEVQRIFLSVKNKESAEILHVFGFYRVSEGCRLVPLGRMIVKNGNGQLQYINNGSFLAGSTIRFDELCGLVAARQEPFSNAYATVWDDKPFGLSLFMKKEAEPIQDENFNQIEETITRITDEVASESAKKTANNLVKETDSDPVKEFVSDSNDLNDANRIKMAESMEAITEALETMEVGEKASQNGSQKINEIWEQLSAVYPHIETLPGDSVVCLKAMPADIGRLPRENWVLSSNGFLMYSFVKHRYIVFARISPDHYELWVPGNYEKSEELMAQMFGFYRFRSVKSKKPGTGDFGYWCVPLVFYGKENGKERERVWQQKMSS